MDPKVLNYLMKKNGLGAQISEPIEVGPQVYQSPQDSKLKEALGVDEFEFSPFLGPKRDEAAVERYPASINDDMKKETSPGVDPLSSKLNKLIIPQFISGVGQAIAGQPQDTSYYNSLRSGVAQSFNEQAKNDPKSRRSKVWKQILEERFPKIRQAYGPLWDQISAGDADLIMEPLKLTEQLQQKAQAQEAARESRELNRIDRQNYREDRLRMQKELLDFRKAEDIERDVESLSKVMVPGLDALNIFHEIGLKGGFDFDNSEIDIENNKIISNGQEIDPPGMNIPGLGRQTLYSGPGRELNRSIGKLMNVTLKDRSGAAVTVPEFERLKIEFGQGRLNTEAELFSALLDARNAVTRKMAELQKGYDPEARAMYQQNGGRLFGDVGKKQKAGKQPQQKSQPKTQPRTQPSGTPSPVPSGTPSPVQGPSAQDVERFAKSNSVSVEAAERILRKRMGL